MIIRRLSLIVLAVVMLSAWTRCHPVDPTPVDSQEDRPVVQENASPKVVYSVKADENLIPVQLLMADAVQKDLGLTADQMERIMDFVEVSQEKSREFVAMWPDFSTSMGPVGTTEAKLREFKAWVKNWQSKQKDMRAQVVRMLTPSQSERLKQIQLQHRIAVALTGPELIKALDISEEQLTRIRPLSDRIVEKRLAELDSALGLPPKERRKKSIEISKKWDKAQVEANKLAVDILTPEQQMKLEKLVGKKVEVTWDYDALTPDDAVF